MSAEPAHVSLMEIVSRVAARELSMYPGRVLLHPDTWEEVWNALSPPGVPRPALLELRVQGPTSTISVRSARAVPHRSIAEVHLTDVNQTGLWRVEVWDLRTCAPFVDTPLLPDADTFAERMRKRREGSWKSD